MPSTKKTTTRPTAPTPQDRVFGALRAVSAKLDPLAARLPLAGRLPKPGELTERYIGLVQRGFADQRRLVPGGRTRLKAVVTD